MAFVIIGFCYCFDFRERLMPMYKTFPLTGIFKTNSKENSLLLINTFSLWASKEQSKIIIEVPAKGYV